MPKYTTTVVGLHALKHSLLYFDHVLPLGLVNDFAGVLLPSITAQLQDKRNAHELAARTRTALDALITASLEALPPQVEASALRHRLADVMQELYPLAVKLWNTPELVERWESLTKGGGPLGEHVISVLGEAVEGYISKMCRILDDFSPREECWPIDAPSTMISQASSPAEDDVAIILPSLNLIDVERCSWEQIRDFRRDEEARAQLRRLRLFAYANYEGKPRSYIEDDIAQRIEGYTATAKQWGLETALGAVGALFKSKEIVGGISGSIVAALLGHPEAVLPALSAGAILGIGHITVEVARRHFALRSSMRENPVSYIVYAREKLGDR